VSPIGVFDSGVGGLTVVNALRHRLPGESILYLGDTARLPYGTKSPTTVLRYTRRNVEFLVDRGVKAIVVACNSASALALPRLQATVPLWGVVEPGAEEAARVSAGRIGVIGTEATIASGAYSEALLRHRPELVIVPQACQLFVSLVEEGWEREPATRLIAERYLEPLLEAEVDTVVVGCTHYPLLTGTLRQILGDDVRLVDSAEAVARAVSVALADLDLLAGDDEPVEHHFCVTDSADRFRRIARHVLGEDDVSLELVDVHLNGDEADQG
jgi:glutamate racemase